MVIQKLVSYVSVVIRSRGNHKSVQHVTINFQRHVQSQTHIAMTMESETEISQIYSKAGSNLSYLHQSTLEERASDACIFRAVSSLTLNRQHLFVQIREE